jgi:hypothetical protein
MSRRQKWLIGCSACAVAALLALFIAARTLARRFEPYIRAQAIEYLSKRFDSHVELASLRVHVPNFSPLRLLLTHGRGALARVEGEGISLRHKNRQDVPPMLTMKKFAFDVDLGSLFDTPKKVPMVTLDGLEINVPPKEKRLPFDNGAGADNSAQGGGPRFSSQWSGSGTRGWRSCLRT